LSLFCILPLPYHYLTERVRISCSLGKILAHLTITLLGEWESHVPLPHLIGYALTLGEHLQSREIEPHPQSGRLRSRSSFSISLWFQQFTFSELTLPDLRNNLADFLTSPCSTIRMRKQARLLRPPSPPSRGPPSFPLLQRPNQPRSGGLALLRARNWHLKEGKLIELKAVKERSPLSTAGWSHCTDPSMAEST